MHVSDALALSGLVMLEQRWMELCEKVLNKIVDNPLDVLYPPISFNEGPIRDLRNARPYRVKPSKTNRCRDTFINKCEVIF